MKSNNKRSSSQGNQQRCRNDQGQFESCGNNSSSNSSSNSSNSGSGSRGRSRGNSSQPRNSNGQFTSK